MREGHQSFGLDLSDERERLADIAEALGLSRGAKLGEMVEALSDLCALAIMRETHPDE